MFEPQPQTRSYLTRLLGERGLYPRRDLGQNFLIDLNQIDFIVREAELDESDVVLEVGAGTGSLTAGLALWAGDVVSVECDRNLHPLAAAATQPFRNLKLLQCDALQNKNHLAPEVLSAVQAALDSGPDRRLKLVANLPYNIATPVISNLVATDLPWTRMVVTIQHELALRLTAEPRSSAYGSLAVWLQAQCDVAILRKLPPSVFWPKPQVHSAIVRILPDAAKQARIADRAFFHDYIRRVFLHRRKLLRGVVAAMYREQLAAGEFDGAWRGLELPPKARAEELDVATHVDLANALEAALVAGAQRAAQSAIPSIASTPDE